MTTMSIRARKENGQQINESEEWAGERNNQDMNTGTPTDFMTPLWLTEVM